MSSASQFLHVAQFFETIICFSMLILIGQKIFMILRNLQQKHLKVKIKMLNQQMRWKKQRLKQQFRMDMTKHKQDLVEKQEKNENSEQKRNQQNTQNNNHNQRSNIPRQSTLRQSLMHDEIDRTDRTIREEDQGLESKSQQKRKSLTDLRKSQQGLSDQKKSQNRQYEIKDDQQRFSQILSSKRNSINNEIKPVHQENEKNIKLQNDQTYDKELSSHQEPSIYPELGDNEVDHNEHQNQDKQKIKYFIRIDTIFNQYLSIIMVILVLGILTHSTYIFTMVCFFGFIFISLIFTYANLMAKQKNQNKQRTFFSNSKKFCSAIFLFAILVSYWVDTQFSS